MEESRLLSVEVELERRIDPTPLLRVVRGCSAFSVHWCLFTRWIVLRGYRSSRMANPLASCVSSLRSTNALLSSSISILDSGVNDFPRLAKVLQTTRVCLPFSLSAGLVTTRFAPIIRAGFYIGMKRIADSTQHFELLPEPTLQSAQSSLLASLTPEVASLLSKVETHLDKLARREQALIARCELLEGRIGEGRASMGGARGSGAGERDSGSMNGEGSREALRLKQLRGKKERLGYAVERLVLQAQQRERQLRMSVAGR